MNNVERIIEGFNTLPGRVADRWLPLLRSEEVAEADKERVIAALEPWGVTREWIAEKIAGAAAGPAIDYGPLVEAVADEATRVSIVTNRRTAQIEDFRFDVVQEMFWCIYASKLLGDKGVNALVDPANWDSREVQQPRGGTRSIPIKPSESIQRRPDLVVDGSTWWPGMPQIVRDMDVVKGALAPAPGAVLFNSYLPPDYSGLPGSEDEPTFWIDHVKAMFPEPVEHNHFFDYAAHMIQRPEEKVNHGIVVSGGFGIGKDTMLWPLRIGVGSWNVNEVDPDALSKDFNGHVQCVLLMVNEVRPHDDHARAKSFYNKNKSMLAAPPDMIPMELKHKEPIYIKNVLRAIFTTNDYLTMHIPQNDRRLFVMHSRKLPLWQGPEYFSGMFAKFKSGGTMAVINWLKKRDISQFNPTAPPPMTAGKKQVMTATKVVSRTAINEAFELFVGEECGGVEPDVFFPSDLLAVTFDDQEDVARIIKSKSLHHAIADIGYDLVTRDDGKRWQWKGAGKTVQTRMAFVKRTLDDDKRSAAIDVAGKNLLDRVKSRTPVESQPAQAS